MHRTARALRGASPRVRGGLRPHGTRRPAPRSPAARIASSGAGAARSSARPGAPPGAPAGRARTTSTCPAPRRPRRPAASATGRRPTSKTTGTPRRRAPAGRRPAPPPGSWRPRTSAVEPRRRVQRPRPRPRAPCGCRAAAATVSAARAGSRTSSVDLAGSRGRPAPSSAEAAVAPPPSTTARSHRPVVALPERGRPRPGTSVLCPTRRPSLEQHGVAPRRPAGRARSTSSSSGSTARLSGIVSDSPRQVASSPARKPAARPRRPRAPRRSSPARARRTPPGAAPATASARSGCPSTAQRAAAAVGSAGSDVRQYLLELRDVLQVLRRSSSANLVSPVLRVGGHEVQPVARRRVDAPPRSPARPGDVDRRRRQAGVLVGVVRRVQRGSWSVVVRLCPCRAARSSTVASSCSGMSLSSRL